MTTPSYKGAAQPTPSPADGLLGWLGSLFGGGNTPRYKTTPTPPPAPPPAPVCPPCPTSVPSQRPESPSSIGCDGEPGVDGDGDVVVPVGRGPITIVINPAD